MPPIVESESAIVEPMHNAVLPVIAPIVALLTEKDVLAEFVPQLLVIVYEIMAEPEVTPVTAPVELVVATAVLLLLHVPPLIASLKVELPPMQIVVAPVMAGITALLTVMLSTAYPAPQLVDKK